MKTIFTNDTGKYGTAVYSVQHDWTGTQAELEVEIPKLVPGYGHHASAVVQWLAHGRVSWLALVNNAKQTTRTDISRKPWFEGRNAIVEPLMAVAGRGEREPEDRSTDPAAATAQEPVAEPTGTPAAPAAGSRTPENSIRVIPTRVHEFDEAKGR
jgi:hypothetical protein